MISNTNRTYIIEQNKIIKRQQNNIDLYDVDENEIAIPNSRTYVPVKSIDEIYILKKCFIDTETLSFLSENNIVIHFFSRNQKHIGDFFPNSKNSVNKSGFVFLQQLRAFDSEQQRLYLAKQITKGHFLNIKEIYKAHKIKNDILIQIKKLELCNSIQEIMLAEAGVKKSYYENWNTIINDSYFIFTKRTKNPPKDALNILISYMNSRIYNIVLCEIYKTELDPRISFLHEPNYRKLSLQLDIAEIFKVCIGDRIIFKLINKKMITKADFEKENGIIKLKSSGIKKIELEIIQKLSETKIINNMKYNYRGIILKEINKFKRSIVETSCYVPYH